MDSRYGVLLPRPPLSGRTSITGSPLGRIGARHRRLHLGRLCSVLCSVPIVARGHFALPSEQPTLTVGFR
jgi:hypothetical protein